MATGEQTRRSADWGQHTMRPGGEEFDVKRDLVDYLREYAREKPEIVALWCFGIGFILGWKLKPW